MEGFREKIGALFCWKKVTIGAGALFLAMSPEPPSSPSMGHVVYHERLGCTRNPAGEFTGMPSDKLWLAC